MAESPNLKVKVVELLAVWPGEAKVGSPPVGQPVVIVTVRPEPTSFQPYNLAFTAAQAQRLAEDLVSLLETFSCLRLLLLALLAVGFGGGCSARYEAREENKADFGSERNVTAEKSSLAWQVDLLRHDAPAPKAPAVEPKAESRPMGGTVNVTGNTVIVVVPGDAGCPERQREAAAYESKKQSGRTGVHTRIGWPSDYWRHGFSAFGGSLLVWALVGWATWIVAACAFSKEKPEDPMLPIFLTIGLLIAAAVVLQILPEPETGVQFLPLVPWNYSGLTPVCLSMLCWVGIVIAALVVATRRNDAPAVYSAAILLSMGCNLLWSFLG